MILFTWIQFLKEEALDFLGIQSPLEVIRGGSKAGGGERRKTDPAATGTVFLFSFACTDASTLAKINRIFSVKRRLLYIL